MGLSGLNYLPTVVTVSVILFVTNSSCSNTCGLDRNAGWSGRCRDLGSSLTQNQFAGFAACTGGPPNTRKIQITCAPTSGSHSTCTSVSNQSGYFVVFVPDTGGGQFNDTNYSVNLGNGPITSCSGLWTALNAGIGNGPSDVLGYYHGDPNVGDDVSCTDGGGCSVNSGNCMLDWDRVNTVPATTAADLPTTGNPILVCAFIDSPYQDGSGTPPQGAPPVAGVGLVSTSGGAGSFQSLTLSNPVTTPVNLSNWVDYQ